MHECGEREKEEKGERASGRQRVAAKDSELVDERVRVLAVVEIDGAAVEFTLVQVELEQQRGTLVGRVRVRRLLGRTARAHRARHEDLFVVRAPVHPTAEVARDRVVRVVRDQVRLKVLHPVAHASEQVVVVVCTKWSCEHSAILIVGLYVLYEIYTQL